VHKKAGKNLTHQILLSLCIYDLSKILILYEIKIIF
jgi:hypothetical protein